MNIAIVLVHEADVFVDPLEINYFVTMAGQLKQAGHRVTFITLIKRDPSKQAGGTPGHAVMSQLRDAGHKVLCPVVPEFMPNPSNNGQASEAPYLAYEALKHENYDVIHFQDRLAPAYYYLLARDQGLLRAPALVGIHVNQPSIYRLMTGRDVERDYSIPAKCFMERHCIEHADVAYCHSEAVYSELEKLNYRVQSRRLVFPPVLPLSVPGRVRQGKRASGTCRIQELLYAAPLNQAEGLTTFTYALDVLARRGVSLGRVSFLGMEDESFAFSQLLKKHKSNWPFEIRVLSSASLDMVRMKIEDPQVLACMPSPYGARPELVMTALANGRPFLATETADLRRLLPESAFPEYFVASHHLDWANRLQVVLQEGIELPEVPGSTAWQDWWPEQHAELGPLAAHLKAQVPVQADVGALTDPLHDGPMVSACIAHFNRPDSVAGVLESLQNQTFRDFETVVVDDGSEEHHLQQLENMLGPVADVKLVTQENRYLGAVRNTGARNSCGKYLLFLDDDNYAMPHELEVFVRVAEYTQADILCCFSDLFDGDGKPDADSIKPVRRMPFGPDLYYGLLRNGFGDSNCLVRKSTWEALGGFTEHYRIGLDDHEFFARAVLSGYRLLVIPEALFYYRLNAAPMKTSHANRHADFLRVLQPYLDKEMIDPDLLPLLFSIRAGYNLR